MNTRNYNSPFVIDEVDWTQLASIGIRRDELDAVGELDTLLDGGQTNVMTLSLVLLGVDVVVDATLQLVRGKGGGPILEIIGMEAVEDFR